MIPTNFRTTPAADADRVMVGIPAYAHACEDILGQKASAVPDSYLEALVRVDATPLIIPVVEDENLLRQLMALVDGLMLIGGPDIDPEHYQQTAHPGLRKVTPARDKLELTLTRWALRRRLPILAICRGIQVLNVAAGGSLWQDIASQVPGAKKHDHYPDKREDYLAHSVEIAPQSRIAGICRQTRLRVNSLHHQAIQHIGTGLSVVARSSDGIIEAVEGGDKSWIVGVQWHPEWLVNVSEAMRLLFSAFREACRANTALAEDRVG